MSEHPSHSVPELPLLAELDRWASSLDERRVRRELEELRGEGEKLKVLADDFVKRYLTVQDAIKRAEHALEFWEKLSPPFRAESETVAENRPESILVEGFGPLLRGRDAIRRLLAENLDIEEWTIPVIAARLKVAPWAQDASENAIGTALQRMLGTELHRVRTGTYARIPSGPAEKDWTYETTPLDKAAAEG